MQDLVFNSTVKMRFTEYSFNRHIQLDFISNAKIPGQERDMYECQ